MRIALLGPLTVDEGTVRLGSRDRTVLTALAMRPGEVLSAARLADAVWPDAPPASWQKNLQSCMVRLRKALGPESIVTSPEGYQLALPVDAVDGQVFERSVARGRELLTLDSPDHAAFTLREALALWRGRALMELEEWEPGNLEAERLEELRRDAEELWLDAAIQSGHHREVLAEAQAMVRAAPLRERRWQLLALAQYQSGRQGEALRTLQELRRLLVSELGLDPGPELVDLEGAILRQDPALQVESAPTHQDEGCPYRGLTPYDVDDADVFFGRDADVASCLERLASAGVLAVVGPSGSGKSSLVRAGVAAALVRDGKAVVLISPGTHPVDMLSALPDGSRQPVLVVDQCEEVFSSCQDTHERRTFLDKLVEHARTAPVLVALRADRMGDVSAYPAFAKLVERGLYVLAAMGGDDLAAAIEGPARQAGLVVEPGLTDLLVREVESEPGALPLLSHALRETWLRREGRTLTVAGYQASGGIRGAVAKSAEDVYGSVTESERRALRDMLLRLVTPGLDGEPVRSRVPRRLVVSDEAQDRLIDLLVGARLVTSDGDAVELAHESLARAWPRLGAWLQDDVDGQRILHHLTSAADAWNSLGRPDSELYRGARLAQALEWRSRRDAVLTPDEVAFLERAETVATEEQRAAADRARTQSRLIRRLRGVLAGASVLLVLALVAGALAVQQQGAAEDNAATAIREATSADARAASARALVSEDVAESMLLAAAGVRLDNSPETRSSLLAALARNPELTASTQMTGAPVISFDVSPDGRTVATYDEVNHVRHYELGTGELLGEYQAGTDRRTWWVSGQVIFSPDGSTLAVDEGNPSRRVVTLLDARTMQPLAVQPETPGPMRWLSLDLVFSRDGRRLAATAWRVEGRGATLAPTQTTPTSMWALVWALDEPRRPVTQLRVADGGFGGVALSPDGHTMYTTGPLTIHDLASGTSEAVQGAEDVQRVAISPDGRLLAGSSSSGSEVVLLDAATGRTQRRLQVGGEGYAYIVAFSGDGSRVATVATADRAAVVWDVRTGALLARLPLGEGGEVVDFGADGSTVHTAGANTSLRHWDLDGDRRFLSEVAATPQRGVTDVVPAPGGALAALHTFDQVKFADMESGAVGPGLDRGTSDAGRGSWHPDAIHYALATGDQVRVWDARAGRQAGRTRLSGGQVSGVDYSIDGSRLVMAELSGRVSMLDSTSLTPVGLPVLLDQHVCCLSVGPDNHTAIAVTGPRDPSGFWFDPSTLWVLVDLESGTVLDEGELGMTGSRVDFSPDGRHVAVGSTDGRVLVLDVVTGEPTRPAVVGHQESVTSLTYAADGDRILTGGEDTGVGLWDGTGELVTRILTPLRLPVAVFGADPDLVRIVDLYGGGPIFEWDTSVARAITFACRVAGRGFTEAEWQDNFGNRAYQETCPS